MNRPQFLASLSLLIVWGCLFSVLFGQGFHLHFLSLHFDGHKEVHVHLHAHPSPDDTETDRQADDHRHELQFSDITGTLAPQVTPPGENGTGEEAPSVLVAATATELWISEIPVRFGLPPPKITGVPLLLSSNGLRAPPFS